MATSPSTTTSAPAGITQLSPNVEILTLNDLPSKTAAGAAMTIGSVPPASMIPTFRPPAGSVGEEWQATKRSSTPTRNERAMRI